MAQLRQKFTTSHLPVHMLSMWPMTPPGHNLWSNCHPALASDYTKDFEDTWIDDNSFSLCLKKWGKKKTESSHILSVPFKDMTDLIHFLRYLFTFSPDLITSGNKKKISCFLIHLTGREDNQLRNVQHKNVPYCQMNSTALKSRLTFTLLLRYMKVREIWLHTFDIWRPS